MVQPSKNQLWRQLCVCVCVGGWVGYSSFREFDSSGKAALVTTEAIVILSVGSLCPSQSALRTEHSGLARCGLWRTTRCVHLCPKPDTPHGLAAGGLRAPHCQPVFVGSISHCGMVVGFGQAHHLS